MQFVFIRYNEPDSKYFAEIGKLKVLVRTRSDRNLFLPALTSLALTFLAEDLLEESARHFAWLFCGNLVCCPPKNYIILFLDNNKFLDSFRVHVNAKRIYEIAPLSNKTKTSKKAFTWCHSVLWPRSILYRQHCKGKRNGGAFILLIGNRFQSEAELQSAVFLQDSATSILRAYYKSVAETMRYGSEKANLEYPYVPLCAPIGVCVYNRRKVEVSADIQGRIQKL